MIRKLMVAVAVLGIAGSGAIAQGVSFSGSANMGVIYSGKTTDDDGNTTMQPNFTWLTNFDLVISGEGTTDGGLTFGAATSIDGNKGGGDIDDTTAYIGGESWKITIGDVDPATDKGKLLGDVGYDGLGVDDVAEHIGGTPADVEVSFGLGTASLAITFGQEAGMARMMTEAAVAEKPGVPAMYNIIHRDASGDFLKVFKSIALDETFTAVDNAGNEDASDDVTATYYLHKPEDSNEFMIYRINGVDDRDVKDGAPGTARTDVADVNPDEDGDQADTPDSVLNAQTDLNLPNSHSIVLGSITDAVDAVPAMPAEYSDAEKQKTHWATGVSFDVGGTTLGIGIDSNKLMQTSIKADLGAFSGTLFYSQQEMDDVKSTGTGVEIGVSAGENTSINAVYAQGKTGDDTSKGFGVGVSHGLGGGASLAAGFAKVKDQTKASVGVTMSF